MGVNLDPIQPAVFAASIAPRIGISMPMVPSGSYAIGRVSTSLPAAPKAKSADADVTAGALDISAVTPKRISARLELAIEDIAAIGAGQFRGSVPRENVSLGAVG